MSLHKYALIRYRIIDSLLRNKFQPYPTIEQIRTKCEESLFGSDYGEHVSISTIEKDLRAMREDMELGFEAPIKYSRKYNGYFYTDPEFTIQKIPLKSEDVDAIKLAANTLFNFRESPLFAQFRFAIEKIFDRLNIATEVQDTRLENVVQFDAYPNYPGNEYLTELYTAITEKKVVEIAYQKFNATEQSLRLIHPYLLKEYRYRWYLIGFSEEKSKVITFALDRMVSVKTTDSIFEINAEFNPDSFFKYSFGITQNDTLPEEIILRFNNEQLGYIETQALHSTQEITKHTKHFDVKLFLVPSFEFYEKILSYGDKVEVISPKTLRKKIKEKLKDALENY
jgi:predicted DNA-binding transcriptional regulator YafY